MIHFQIQTSKKTSKKDRTIEERMQKPLDFSPQIISTTVAATEVEVAEEEEIKDIEVETVEVEEEVMDMATVADMAVAMISTII